MKELKHYAPSFARRNLAWVLLRAVRSSLRLLPTKALVDIKESLSPVVPLDYERSRILLHADSRRELKRARACHKEPETVQWIEECIRPDEVFYDIGANVGAYALIAAKHSGGRAMIHAFEPSFSTFAQLCRNVLLNDCGHSIMPHMIALSRKTGTTTFNYFSTAAGASLHALGASVDYKGDAFDSAYHQLVISYSLDDLILNYEFPAFDHLKLDVDGIELEILHGASRVLETGRAKSVLVEVCENRNDTLAITEFMVAKGFHVAAQHRHGGGVANIIFRR